MNYKVNALIFRAMGDETRIRIIDMLRQVSLCACKILDAFNCTQPTLSYHMKILCDCGLVFGKKEGKWIHYSLNRELFSGLKDFLSLPSEVIEDCSCK